MAVTQQSRSAPPVKITGLLQAKWANQVLKTAVELDVFSILNEKAMTAGELAAGCQANERGMLVLIQALTAMEFVHKSGDQFALTDISKTYLVKSSPLYFGEYILFKDKLDEGWNQLGQVVRTGQPFLHVNDDKTAQEFFPKLAAAIFPINYSGAQLVADHLKIESQGELRILDLAAGTGVWSIPAAQANKKVKVDALDFPAVIEVTKKFAAKFGVSDQYSYLQGNWRDIKLQSATYDYIYLGHILHSEGREVGTELLKFCANALKPGGIVVVAEFIMNEDHTGPVFAALFEINMMIATTRGCAFSVKELDTMFAAAGLGKGDRLELPFWGADSPVILSRK